MQRSTFVLALTLALAGCKSGGTPSTTDPVGNAPVASGPNLPTATAAATLELGAARAIATVFVAADGALAIGSGLAAPMEKRKRIDLASLNMLVHESVALGIDVPVPEEDVVRDPTATSDDPEEDDLESGGTGTAMALEEGKMGKKDSDRAEGQYKMTKQTDDPGPPPTTIGHDERGVLGEPRDQLHAHVPVVIAVAPRAPATVLADVLDATLGTIAVVVDGKPRALRVQFFDGEWRARGAEAPADTKELVLETGADLAALAGDVKGREVRVLVKSGDAQALVDVIVALERNGAKRIALARDDR